MSCLGKYPDERPKTAWELALAYEQALGRRLSRGSGRRRLGEARRRPVHRRPAVAGGAIGGRGRRRRSDRRIRQSVDANMPEAMAMVKLKGFIYDLGGEVVESVPGLIKVRLLEKPSAEQKNGMFGWIKQPGRSSATVARLQSTEIELHMERRDPSQTNRLTITLVMRSSAAPTTEWRDRCGKISRDLQAYLMGR